MTTHFGAVPAGSVLPIHFGSYDSDGASVTLTGLAVTDVEIYKGTTVTQRSSDAGIALIDTDGIDIDGITGAHGFSIDTGDNTDSGFYSVGSFFNVWVSAVTIDAQTVNFLAATFHLVAAQTATLDTIKAVVDDILTDTAVIGAAGAGLTAVASQASVDDLPTSAELASALGDLPTAVENADALLNRDMATGTDSGSASVRTVRQALRFLRNKWSIAGGTLTVTKEDDATASWTSAVTTTESAEPVTASDPAGP